MGVLCSLYPRKKSGPGNPEWQIDTIGMKTGSFGISEFF
jgi:hypothetical protein